MTPSKHPRLAPSTTPTKVDSVSPSDISKMHLHNMPDICPCDTTYPSDTRRYFNPINIHIIFGCRQFRNPKHIASDNNNATPIGTGKPPTTLGAFTTTP